MLMTSLRRLTAAPSGKPPKRAKAESSGMSHRSSCSVDIYVSINAVLTLPLSLNYLDKHFYLLFKRCYTDAPEKRLETGVKRKGIIVLHDYVCVCVWLGLQCSTYILSCASSDSTNL